MIIPASAEVIPDDVSSLSAFCLNVANDAGASADIYGDDTYAMYFNGNNYGLTFETDSSYNFSDTTGENLFLNTSDGSFYLNFYGGKGGVQRVILMLAVNGTVSNDFSAHFTATGYDVGYNSERLFGSLSNLTSSDISYETGVSEYFSKSDFEYGPQVTRPPEKTAIYHDQDINDTTDKFQIMFIDTNLGIIGNKISNYGNIDNSDLTNTGKLKIDYHIEGLGDSMAVIDAYGWIYSGSESVDNLNPSISWTNMISTDGEVRIVIENETTMEAPVASFTVGSTWGEAPFTVQFTDTSTGYPTSWYWDFGDGENSTSQNPSHLYHTAGTYTVNLTATNSGGNNTTVSSGIISVTISGGSLLADSACPEFGYNSQNTGQSPYNGPQTATLNWNSDVGSFFYTNSGIAIDSDETIYAASYGDKSLYALYPNGTQKWKYNTGNSMSGMPAVSSDGTIYVPASSILYAINSDGTLKWMLDGASNWASNIVIGSDGTIYSGSSSNFNAINPNGTLKWTYTTGNTVWYAGASFDSDGTVYIGSKDKYIYALNPDGSLKWRYLTAGAIDTAPSVGSDGTIYIGSQDNYLYAINPEGTLKWKYNAGSMFSMGSTAIGSDGTIYIGTFSGGKFLALNPDGTLKWSTSVDTYTIVTPALGSDGAIYFGSWTTQSSGNIYALNPDGSVKWKYPVSSWIVLSPAIAQDGTLYVGCGDGNIYAIENVVDFSTDKTSGGSPLTVQFTGTTSRNVSSWFWDFGDGTNSTMQNPSHEYSSDGSYTVNLTITDQDSGDTFSAEKPGYINAYIEPVAAFSADIYSGQAPLTVNFADTSTNNPTGWLWNFGDGSNSTEQNPTHEYTSDGTYSVTLSVENPAGNDTYTNSSCIIIEAQPVPVVDFSSSVTDGQAPLEVTFTDLSTESPVSWSWDFGDGSTSSSQNPTHTYEVYGNYTVELTATNYGGSNSTTKTSLINVSIQDPPVASFNANETSGMTPFSVAFTDSSTGHNITGWSWDFGDGTNSSDQDPEHTYTIGGDFNVTLNATNDGGSNESTIIISVSDVHPPIIEFSANWTWGKYPLTVEFTDESTLNPNKWLWDFGDGTNSTEQNPVHTFRNVGEYNINLTAWNDEGGNTSTKTNYIYVGETYAKPLPAGQSINIYVANDEGVKYNVENGVTDSSRYVPYVFINNTYHFLYNGKGGGTDALHVSDDPSDVRGQVTKTTNQSGEFWLTFTGGQPYLYDGLLLLAVNGTIPDDFSVHIRSSGYEFDEIPAPAVGNVISGLTTSYVDEGINQTFTREDFIYGPQIWRPHRVTDYPVFVDQNMSDTSDTFEMMFIDLRLGCTQTKSDGCLKVEYEFNNLTTFAVFNGYGWYSASNHGTGIIMTTSGSEYQVMGISDQPAADFTINNTPGYVLVPVQFTDTSTNVPTKWFWDFGDGTNSTDQNPTHTYTAAGNYTVTLTATNYKGSDSTSAEIIQIAGESPVAEFSADKTSGESPLKINFTDESTNSPVQWFWDFGDGTNSTDQNPVHWYAPGKYSVNLTVTNGGGSSSLVKEDYITVSANAVSGRIINPDFETGNMTGWESGTYASVSGGQAHDGSYSVLFSQSGNNPYSNNYVSQNVDLTSVSSISFWGYQAEDWGTQYFRVYMDGTLVQTDTCVNSWTMYTIPVANYTGVHEVRIGFDRNMMGIDAYIDDFSTVIEFAPPVAGFSATPVSGNVPLTVQFTDTSSNYPASWSWDFDSDGNIDSTKQNPEYIFSSMGTYTVSLTVANADGNDTLVKRNYITVKGVQKTTSNVSIKNNGTLTDDGNGNKQYSINQSEAKVSGNNIVIDSGNYTITIKSDKTPETTGSSLVSEVTGIELETDPVETVLDELGNVSGSVNLELNDLPEDSGLEITLEKGESGNGTAFQVAASSSGLDVGSVAYTMNIVKSNLANGQEIKEATITMSVPESWVNAHGGVDAIKIIRIAEDGNKEVLDTTYVGTNNSIMTFEGYSPNGLSLFGLASTTQQATTTASSSYSSGTSVSASGGGTSDIGIDGAENLEAGDMATLHFDETSIYEMDLYAKEDIPQVFVTVEAEITPENAESPEGDVYEYIAALLYDAPAENVNKYTVRFGVLSDWVDSRLSSPDLLSLYYYDEEKDEWTKLSTVFDSEENGVCYYYADSADIGYLAITAVPDLDQVKSSSLKSEVTEQPTLAEVEKSADSATTVATAKATPLFGSMIVFVAFGLFCIIAIANRRCSKNKK